MMSSQTSKTTHVPTKYIKVNQGVVCNSDNARFLQNPAVLNASFIHKKEKIGRKLPAIIFKKERVPKKKAFNFKRTNIYRINTITKNNVDKYAILKFYLRYRIEHTHTRFNNNKILNYVYRYVNSNKTNFRIIFAKRLLGPGRYMNQDLVEEFDMTTPKIFKLLDSIIFDAIRFMHRLKDEESASRIFKFNKFYISNYNLKLITGEDCDDSHIVCQCDNDYTDEDCKPLTSSMSMNNLYHDDESWYNPNGVYMPTTEPIRTRNVNLLQRLRFLISNLRNATFSSISNIYNKFKIAIMPVEGIIDDLEMVEFPKVEECIEAQMMEPTEGAHGAGDCTVEEESNVAIVEEVKPSVAKPISLGSDVWENLCSSQQYAQQVDLMSRWKLMHVFSWDVNNQQDSTPNIFDPNNKQTQNLPTRISLPFDFIKMHGESPNCILFKQFAYFRSDIEIKIKVNATNFYQGALQASFYYASDFDDRYTDRNNIASASQMTHAIVDASSNNPAVLNIPYRYYKPLMGTCVRLDDGDTVRLGELRILILNQLKAPTSSKTNVKVAVYVRFIKPTFHGMKPRNMGALQIESQMMASIIKGAIDGGAEALLNQIYPDNNRDNPPSMVPPRPMVPWVAHSWAVGDKSSEPINPMRLQATGQTPYPPGTLPSENETDLEFIFTKFGFVNTFEWSDDMQEGSKIFSIPYSPILRQNDYKSYDISNIEKRLCFALPPVGMISSLFAYWRGSIEIRLDIVCTSFHKGTLIIAFVPRVSEVQTIDLDSLTDCDHLIVNLSECRQFSYIAKFVSDKPWWPRRHIVNDADAAYAPGFIYCCVVNPLRAMSSVSSKIDINLYMRGHVDFEVQILSNPTFALSYNTNLAEDDSILMSYGSDYGPPVDEIYCSDWSGVFPDRFVFRYGTLSDKITPFMAAKLEDYFFVYKLHNEPTGTIWLYDEASNKYNADCIILIPTSVIRDQSDMSWRDCFAIPVNLIVHKKEFATFCITYEKIMKEQKLGTSLANLTFETGFVKNANKYRQSLTAAFKSIAHQYYGTATDKFVASERIYWHAGESIYSYKEEEDFVFAQGDERDCVLGEQISLHPNINSTWSGLLTFGEQVTNLKQIIRRYVPYGFTKFVTEKGENYNLARVDCVVPLLPQGLHFTPTKQNFYSNVIRDGTISSILSGFRFYRGGMRLRIIINGDYGVQIWAQHIPDGKLNSLEIQCLKFKAGELPTSAKFILNSGYAICVQDSRVNPILEIEIPFYMCTQLGLLQRPKMSMKQDGSIFSLGNLTLGLNHIGTVPKESSNVFVTIMYSCADDFTPTVFQGFPLVFSLPKKTTLGVDNIESQGPLNYIEKKFSKLCEKRAKEKVAYQVGEAIKEAKLDEVESADSLLQYIMDLLPECNAMNLWRIVREFVHMYISGSVKTICFSMLNIFTEIGMISVKCVKAIADKLYDLLEKVKAFSSLQTKEEDKVVAQTIFSGDDQEVEACEAALISTIVSGVFASLGIINRPIPHTLPSFAKFLYEGTGTFSRTSNGLFTFFKNNLKMIKAVWFWVMSKCFPDHTLALELENSSAELQQFARRVGFCLDARNDSVIRSDPKACFQVHECANIAQIILSKMTTSTFDYRNFSMLKEQCGKIITLRDKLTREFLSPPIRFEPFVLCLEGDSKIGKSFMSQEVICELLQAIDYKSYNQITYVRTPGNAYWNGLQNQPFVIYDDFMAINDETVGIQQVSELFCLKSCAVFNPPMAAVEDKNIRYNPLGVVLLTNKPFLVPAGIATEEAMLRRRDLVVKVEKISKYANVDINNIPRDVKKVFGHLQFRIYTDSTKQNSLSNDVLDYPKFNAFLVNMFKNFYENELINYNDRLKQLSKFYPDADLSLSMNCDKLSNEILHYEKQLLGDEYTTIVESKKKLRDMTYFKDLNKAYIEKRRKVFGDNSKASDKDLIIDRATGLPIPTNMLQKPTVQYREQILVEADVEPVVAQIGDIEFIVPEEITKECMLSLYNQKHEICFNVNHYKFMSYSDRKVKECYCEALYSNFRAYKLMYNEERSDLKKVLCKKSKITTTYIDLEPVILSDPIYGHTAIVYPCDAPKCYMNYEHLESREDKLKAESLIRTVLSVYGSLMVSDQHLPQSIILLKNKLYGNKPKREEISDKLIEELTGSETKNWLKSIWEKIPSFWTVTKFLAGSIIFISLLKIAFIGIVSLSSAIGLGSTAAQVCESAAVGATCGVTTAAAGATIYGNRFLRDTHWDKSTDNSQMQSSGTSMTVARRGIGRITPREMVCAQGMVEDNLRSVVRKIVRNTFFLVVKCLDSGRVLAARCLGLFERKAIILDHYIIELDCFRLNHPNNEVSIVTSRTNFPIEYKHLKFTTLVDSAIMVVTLPNGYPQFKDIMNLMSTCEMTSNISPKCLLVETQLPDKITSEATINLHYLDVSINNSPIYVNNKGDQSVTIVNRVYTYAKSANGICGSVLISNENTDRPILGIHIAGKSTSQIGYSEMLVFEEYSSIYKELTVGQIGEPEYEDDDYSKIDIPNGVVFEGIVKKSWAQNISPKSRLALTECANKITNVTYDFPLLHSKDVRIIDNPFSPLSAGIQYHGLHVKEFDELEIANCIRAYKFKILACVKPMRLTPGKLTIEESICGIPNNNYYESLDMQSSEGYPWNLKRPKGCKNKSWLFNRTETKEGWKLNSINKELLDKLNLNEQIRAQRRPVFTIFSDLLKDAKMPKEKALEPGKTRIFSASPIDYTIACRQYFLDFAVALQESRFENCIGIGIDCDSMEATNLANYLLEVGNNIIVGDYKKFGDTLSIQCVSGAFDIMRNWNMQYFKEKPTNFDLDNMLMLEEEVKFSVHIAFDLVYRMIGGMPSGNPLTVIINSIVNVLYLMYVYNIIMKKEDPSFYGCDMFFKHVRVVTYGDDFIMSVSDSIRDIYNFKSIRETLATYDIIMTDASKSNDFEIPLYRDILDKEVTFLKRNFILHPWRNKTLLMALDKRAIEETCNWYWSTSKDSKGSSIEACEAMLRNAYSQGKQYYDDLSFRVFNYWQAEGVFVSIPSWDEMDVRIFSK